MSEEIEQSAEWEARLIRGECSVDEALSMCMHLGVPVPPFVREMYERAWDSYRSGEAKDLADALGSSVTQRERRAQDRITWVSHVRTVVDGFSDRGFTKNNPSYYDSTAFHEAAKQLSKSPTQIFDTYYGK